MARLQRLILPILFCLLVTAVRGETTISTADNERFGYGANTGWVSFRWDTGSPGDGAVVTDFFLAGYVYGANVGWINLGDGSPANGIQYGSASAGDIGVNHDGLGNLSGWAYGANIGWINFGNPAGWNNPPKINLVTGKMSGYAWGANVGWIDLGTNGTTVVKTEAITITDSDGDMVSDAWELTQVGNAGLGTGTVNVDLMNIGKTTDSDGDGKGGQEEFLADTDPFDPLDSLRVTDFSLAGGTALATVNVTWTAKSTRVYDLESATSGLRTANFSEDLTNLPGSSPTMNRVITGPVPRNKFWEVEVKLPLTP
jgi:hypothetical protein